MKFLIFLVLLFSLSVMFIPNTVFAIDAVQVKNQAVTAAGAVCDFSAMDTSTASLTMPEKIKIQIRILAENKFVESGLPGQWLPTYKDAFMSMCETMYAYAFGMAPDIPTDPSSKYGAPKYQSLLETAKVKGTHNVDCYQDGVNDYNEKKSQTQPNPVLSQARFYSENMPIPTDLRQAEFLNLLLDSFYEGCKFSYNKGYGDAMQGDTSLSKDERNLVAGEEANANGKGEGLNDPECKSEGRKDFDEGNSRDPNIIEINVRQALINPYNFALDFSDYENFRKGYEEGCTQAYYAAYDSAKRQKSFGSSDGGCLIATAAYGTELDSKVQNLREIRNKMYETELGGNVMHTVNDFYYSFSPTVSDWERQSPIFRETIKILITPSMTSFTLLDHNDIDSENNLIGYVLGIVSLNIGMYFVTPTVIVWQVKKRLG